MVITINRPEARNAVNGAVSIVVGDALEEAHDNPDVRAVVITGAGDKSLCAGADLKAIARRENPYHPHHGGPYRRRARLDAVRIVVSSATRNAGSYTCVSTGSAGCREITPPLAGPTPGPVNPGPPAGTLRTSLHILTTPTAKVRPA